MKRQLGDLLTDDRGDDLIEYALLCGLIGAIGVVAFPDIADKMSAAYSEWVSSAKDAWNPSTNNVDNSCAPTCAPISPRLVAIAVFDVERYQFWRANNAWPPECPGGGGGRCVHVVNIIGFFVESTGGPGEATGFVARYPGLVSPDSPLITTDASFAPAITLVR